MAIRHICGAECGIAEVGTLSGGTEHVAVIAGTPTVVTTGPLAGMRSTRCFKFLAAGADQYVQHNLATNIASPATVVARVYYTFNVLPASNCRIFSSNNFCAVMYNASDHTLRAGGEFETDIASSGYPIEIGKWYCVDIKGVRDTTVTVDISVDGRAQTQWSLGGQVAAVAATCRTGLAFYGTATGEMYCDDIIFGDASGDYPFGAGRIYGLYPASDGTHVYSANTDFLKAGTAATGCAFPVAGETTSWQSLKNPLSTTIDTAKFITDALGGTGEYMRWLMGDMPADAQSVQAVQAVLTSHSASTTANALSLFVIDQSAGGATPSAVAKELTVAGTAAGGVFTAGIDMSETGIATHEFIRLTGETTGAWSVANVNDLAVIFGSTDVNPDVYLDGIMLEVAFKGASALDMLPAAVPVAAQLLVVSASVSLPITPATVAVTGEALGISGAGGAQNIALSPAEVAVTAQALSRTASVSIAATPAEVAVTAQALVRSAGGVSLALGVATVAVTPQALVPSASVSLALSPASVSVTPQALTISLLTTIAVSPATVTVTAQALVRSAAVSVALSPASVPVTPQALSITPGAVSVALGVATVTVTPQALVRSASVSLALPVVTVALTPQALVVSAAVSIALPVASVAVTPQALDIDLLEFTSGSTLVTDSIITITLVLTPAEVSVTAQALSRTASVSRALTPATVAVVAQALSRLVFTSGSLVVADTVSIATTSLAVTPVTITVEAVALVLDQATYTSGSDLVTDTVATSGQYLVLTPATVTVTPVALGLSISVNLGLVIEVDLAPALTITEYVQLGEPYHFGLIRETNTALGPMGADTANTTLGFISEAAASLFALGATKDFILNEETDAAEVDQAFPLGISAFLAISPAVIAVTAVQLTATTGASSVALSPATVTVAAQALVRTSGGISLALSPASVVVTPQALVRTAAISLAISPAVVAVTAGGLGVKADQFAAISPAVVAVVGSDLVAGNEPFIGPVIVSVAAQPLSITAAAPSLALGPAVVAVAAQALDTLLGEALAPAVVQVVAQPLTLSPGAISLALSPAEVAVTAQPVTFGTLTASVALSPAVVTVEAQAVDTTTGAVALTLDPVVIAVEAAEVVSSPGEVTLPADPAVVAVTAEALSPDTNVSVPVHVVEITVTGNGDLGIAPGLATVPISPAVVIVAAATLVLFIPNSATSGSVDSSVQPNGDLTSTVISRAGVNTSVGLAGVTSTVTPR